MRKTDLVSYVATHSDLTKIQANKALEAVLEGIKESLQKGEDVRLVRFGTFAVKKTAA